MDISSLRLVYFSPTQTTRKVIESIARGLQIAGIEQVDLTLPSAVRHELMEMHDELSIIGSPVYGGRLPADAISRFRRLKGNGTPSVIVVLYGNRAYEDALLELKDLVLEVGFHPVAAGAFVGEHSYSTNDTPVAVGRPDLEDLNKAEAFGRSIGDKLRVWRALVEMPPLRVPGNFPYKELQMLTDIAPVTREAACSKCAKCASLCPAAAITVGDTVVTLSGLCIRCCACLKSCPTGARTMEDARVKKVAEYLMTNCSERKEPETYI